jgi:hypothetical protein
VIAKNQLQGKTRSSIGSSANHNTNTNTPTPNAATIQTAPPEYTPSIEDQYLPKSLRGNSNNPYSIMNATAINESRTVNTPTATATATATATLALAPDPITTIVAPPEIQSSTPSTEYTPSEKEVTVESSIIQNTT